MTITVEVPITTKNPTNTREHHMVRAKRVKAQRAGVGLMLRANAVGTRLEPVSHGMRLVVLLTRVSPGTLDKHDNLRAALKHVVDEVAAYFGVDDADKRVEWRYAQVQGKPSCVRIELSVEDRIA